MKGIARFPLLLLLSILCSTGFLTAQEKSTPTKAIQRLNRAPVNHEVLKVTLPRPAQSTLDNGLTVLLLERHKTPTLTIALWINTGSLDDPKDLPGLAEFTADMLQEGTASRNSSRLATEIDSLGASLNASVRYGSTYTQVAASGFAENAGSLLDLLSDMTLHPAFPNDELEKYKTRLLSDLEQQRSDPDFLSRERLFRALYGNSPAAVISATPASVKAVTADQLKQFHSQHYLPNKALLGVAGDFDSKQMMALIKKYFGPWKKGIDRAASASPPPAAEGFKIYLVDRADSVQSNLLAGELVVPRNNPDYVPMRVLNRVLGDGASSRLFMNLREDKGYTYGAYSGFAADTYPRPILINTEVRNAVTDGSIHELLGELKRLREEPVPGPELDEARRSIVAGFALSLESNRELLNLWMQTRHNGLADDYWDRYPGEIAKVDPAAVQRVAQKYLALERLQFVCVGSAKEIGKVLEKYGPVEIYDTEGKKVSK